MRALQILAVLTLHEAFAAANCGKGTLKVRFGQKKVFTSPRLQAGNCRYRVRVPRGLNIRITFEESNVDPCCFTVYDASAHPFKWRIAEKLSTPTGPLAAGTTVTFETDVIGIQVKAAARQSPVSFTYEAIIPASGSFGYDFKATRKRQVIRTPGFPRRMLPSGVRSRWNIHTASSSAITLVLNALNTASDDDYVEIYDGDRLLGRHSGILKQKKSPIEYDAFSGTMAVYLQTETSRSRGFKASVQLTDKVAPSVTATERTGALMCHQRNRIISQGLTISDQHSTMTCESDQICARMVIEGEGSTFGPVQHITSETLNCMPRQICSSNLCDSMPPPPDVTIRSCQVQCCSTEMCNRSPDGPDVPSESSPAGGNSLPVWPFTRVPRLRCHESSEIITESGHGIGQGSSSDGCEKGQVCALYVYKGTEKGTLSTGAVTGYTAMCAAESNCTEEACRSIPDSEYATITSCNVTCCSTDMCNDPALRPTPPPKPTPPPEPTLRCYELMIAPHPGGEGYLNNTAAVSCQPGINSRCARIDAVALTPAGEVKVSAGKCVPATFCSSLDCSSLEPQGSDWKSCLARCCNADLCNDQPVTRPPGSGLRCHQKSEFTQEGAISLGSPTENEYCSEGEVCASYIYYGTIRDNYNNIDEPIAGQFGGCAPRATCDRPDACASLPDARNANISSCNIKCCGSDMCNKPIDTPMPSPYPGPFLRCYDILKSSSGGLQPLNRKKPMTCERFSKCIRVDAVASDGSGREIATSYGHCLPSYTCESVDCSILGSAMPGLQLSSCKASCCDSDFCNENELPATTEAPSSALSPTLSPSGSEAPSGIECYQLMEIRGMGMVLPGSEKFPKQCEPGWQCMLVEASAVHRSFSPMEMNVAYGTCVPFCAGQDACDNIPTTQADTRITSCKVSCCQTDLCNSPP